MTYSYIIEYPGALSDEFCDHVIDKFERDNRHHPGRTVGGVMPDIKQSTDLRISGTFGWEDEDSQFYQSLATYYADYESRVIRSCATLENPSDTGYQIQRTKPGEFYTWHHDFSFVSDNSGVKARVATFIWYLNTITEGGETEFITGEKIKPEKGKLLMFPATWTFAHRGCTPVKEIKHICTGWMLTRIA